MPAARLEELLKTPAHARAQWFLSASSDPDLIMSLGDEAERLALVDAAKAQEAARAVVELAEACGGPRERARTRRAAAQAAAYAGRHEEALRYCEEAHDLALNDAPIEAGRALAVSMHPLGEMTRYEDAERNGERARALLIGAGEPKLAARADINLGVIAGNRDQPERALTYFDRAAGPLADDPLMSGYLQNNRGEALLALGQFSEAREAFAAAMRACEKAGATLAAAIAEGNLADLAARRGRLDEATRSFESAGERMRAAGADSHAARLLGEQAEALLALGQYAASAEAAGKAVELLEGHGLALDAARARACQGRAFAAVERVGDAIETLGQAADAYAGLGHELESATTTLSVADVALRHGQLALARTFGSVESILSRRALNRAQAMVFRARISEPASAEADAEAAVGEARELDIPPMVAEALSLRASARLACGDRDRAVADMWEAVDELERVRGALPAESFRATFQYAYAALYDDLASACLTRPEPDLDQVLRAVELRRSRLLADALRNLKIDLPGDLPSGEAAGLVARREQLTEELRVLYSTLADAGLSGQRPPNVERWRRQALEREREITEIESRLATREGRAGFEGAPSLERVRASIPPDTAIVCFAEARDTMYAIAIDRAGASVVRETGRVRDIVEAVRIARFQIARGARRGASDRVLDDARQALERLYEITIRPIREQIDGARRWIIVPSGALQAAPLHACWDGQRYLLETIDIGYAPSVSTWVVLSERPPVGDAPSLVVAIGDAGTETIAVEGKAVAETLGATLLADDEATSANVQVHLSSVGVAHFACHGWFSPAAPQGSGLRLADRWFTLRDAYQTPIDADLITLSACDTGQVAESDHDLTGAPSAFLRAGARSVLATLWSVADASTSELMNNFYKFWSCRRADGKLSALCEAQRGMLGERPHPFYWAPFTMQGKM
ncbi:MAG: CHAT domain-containing protein [Phycisphaerales bacterium]|nr:CHAT domain-containing protein [Phycisphaerales bacterium]